MMKDNLILAGVLITGIALGLFFFGGLWLTVRKMSGSKRPGLLFMGSFFVRVAVALGGFYSISFGKWQRLLVCLVGFVIGRVLIVYFTRPVKEKIFHLQKGNPNET